MKPNLRLWFAIQISQTVHLSPRVLSTPNRTENNLNWLNHLHKLNYISSLAEGLQRSFPALYLPKNIFDPQKQSFTYVFQNRCSYRFQINQKKTSVLESYYNKVAGLKAILLRRYSKTGLPLLILQSFKNSFFCRAPPVAASRFTPPPPSSD